MAFAPEAVHLTPFSNGFSAYAFIGFIR